MNWQRKKIRKKLYNYLQVIGVLVLLPYQIHQEKKKEIKYLIMYMGYLISDKYRHGASSFIKTKIIKM